MSDEREQKRSANWIFAIIGIALIVAGIVWLVSIEGFKKNAIETEGTITRIDITTNSEDEDQYSAVVEFTVDGITYTGSVGYTAGMKEGDAVTIYYNPNDPQDFQDNSNSIVAVVVFLGLGAACSFVGFFPLIFKAITASRNRRAQV